ncbi:MAG TPA: hypothetical protein VGW77_15660 [Candidatus Binatia bacterium]|jgi:hypothetical protein|nr:hypothetical protein [Candidatus Binatia bacterium]
MDYSLTDLTKKKRKLALRLVAGEFEGSYGDGIIVLCAAISALAAQVWPGKRKERRFVELLKRFAPPELNTTRISVPLLIGWLRTERGREAETAILEKAFLNNPQGASLEGDSVDKSDDEVIRVCDGLLCRNEIRRLSYGSLLYSELRSSYSHEFRPGNQIGFPFSEASCSAVSYWNYGKEPSGTNENEIEENDTLWRIHFKADWIGDVAVAVATALDAGSAKLKRSDPVRWWLDGG